MGSQSGTRQLTRQVIFDKFYELWTLLHYVETGIQKARDSEVRTLGISTIQAAILTVLNSYNEPAPIAEIARWLFREPHTVSEAVSRMKKQGLVKRVKVKRGRGTSGVVLAKKGEETFSQLSEIHRGEHVVKRVMSVLSDKESEQVRICLKKLLSRTLDELAVRPDLPFLGTKSQKRPG